MPRSRELSLAFVDKHPADAARVLGRLSVDDAAAFLGLLPKRLGTPVVQHLLPTFAALCLERLDESGAAGLIRDLEVQGVTAILRYVAPAKREQIVAQLPTTSAVALRVLLSYPDDTTGAWINPAAPTVTADTAVGEVLDRWRRTADSAATYVYVVNGSHRFLGIAHWVDLFRAARVTTVGQLMHTTRHHVSARSSLRSALDHEGWREFHALPVVERNERFLGALEYPTLRRALDQTRAADSAASDTGSVAVIARSSWHVFASLLQALISLLPPARPLSREARNAD